MLLGPVGVAIGLCPLLGGLAETLQRLLQLLQRWQIGARPVGAEGLGGRGVPLGVSMSPVTVRPMSPTDSA